MVRSIVAFLFFLNGFSCLSQTYFPFPKDSATWSDVWVQFNVTGPPNPDLWCGTNHYGLNGDTIIDNNLYSKLFISNSDSDTSFNYNNSKYHLGIREDSTRKVWMRWPSDSIDRLFYDFGLNKGDTFLYWQYGPRPVIAIDSMLINGQYRRTTHCWMGYPVDTLTLIEGVGFKGGLMGPGGGTDGFDLMKCFRQRGQLIYASSFTTFSVCKCTGCDCRSSPVGIEYYADDRSSVLVYPNPVIDFLSVSIDNQNFVTSKVEIYSVNGQKIITTQISEDNHLIDARKLSQGLYILRIENLEKRYYGHFLKTMP